MIQYVLRVVNTNYQLYLNINKRGNREKSKPETLSRHMIQALDITVTL